MNNLPKIGRYLLAAPMLIYPILHFIYGSFVATFVPPWIPWHLFWTYFTAVTIFAGGLAILFRTYAYVAAILLGIEIFLFCVLIHGVILFHQPGDAFAEQPMFGDISSRLINSFKDFGLCGAVFIFAATQSKTWKTNGANELFTIGRLILGLSIFAFGVLHYLYPAFSPGIPPMLTSVSFILPGLPSWVYLTSVVLVLGGLLILTGEKSRTLVTWLGIILLVVELLVWTPHFVAQPRELWGNWLKDVGIIGGIFIFAGTLPEKPKLQES